MRLIDGDELLNELDRLDLDYGAMGGVAECIAIINDAPTIEPSDNRTLNTTNSEKMSDCGGDLISRQWLLDLYELDTTDFKETAKVPLEVVIQNIKDAPSVSIQPKTIANDCDLISRADAIEAIQNAYCKPCKERGDDYNEVRCRACEYDNAIMQIDALPSADVVSREEYNKLLNDSIWQSEHIKKMFEYQTESADRPKGEWKVENHEVVCSVCGQNNLETNFCPCCGADMRGDQA